MKKARITLFSIMAAMIFTLAFSMTSFAAPKLSKTSITITEGKTKKLKVKNKGKKKVAWRSGNKKIATVSKDGVVKAKKAGHCKITAKVGKKRLVCQVRVKADNRLRPAMEVISSINNKDDISKMITALANDEEENIYIDKRWEINVTQYADGIEIDATHPEKYHFMVVEIATDKKKSSVIHTLSNRIAQGHNYGQNSSDGTFYNRVTGEGSNYGYNVSYTSESHGNADFSETTWTSVLEKGTLLTSMDGNYNSTSARMNTKMFIHLPEKDCKNILYVRIRDAEATQMECFSPFVRGAKQSGNMPAIGEEQ